MYTINIDLSQEKNKYLALYNYIRRLIETGAIKANEKLPSKRDLASSLNVSINTIMNAYNALLSQDYIYSKEKSGYFVNADRKFNYEQNQNNSTFINQEIKYKLDFTSENVDSDFFPFYTFKKVTNEVLADNPDIWLTRSSSKGNIQLRQALVKYLFESKGIVTSEENIIIVSSIDESLYIINNLIKINSIGIGEYYYSKVLSFFKNQNKEIVYFKNYDEYEFPNKNIDLLYITPYNQFPLFDKTPLDAKIDLINKPYRYILEDDFDYSLIDESRFTTSLKYMCPERVIMHGSFSRSLCPGLRISYLVLPDNLLPTYNQIYKHTSSSISQLDQQILAAFLEKGYYYRHINHLKKCNQQKKEIIRSYLKSHHISYEEKQLAFLIPVDDVSNKKKHLNDALIKIRFLNDYTIGNDNRMILCFNQIHINDLNNALEALFNIL